ncbi:MAG: hypothetical protein HFG62_09865 [Lachnospiraceae bacterium]|jgi:glucan-binding YG repeat protein|nr:hypothetical protein [Lachnospiraceae bacterium]
MGKGRKAAGLAAGILLLTGLYGGDSIWAAQGRWEYHDQADQWYYLNDKGEYATGRQTIDGGVYFFDENGVMLTGWVSCPKEELPEPYSDSMDGADIYYCGTDGKMAKGWVVSYSPEDVVYDRNQDFDLVREDMEKKRYYFDDRGRPYCGQKKTIDGKRYIFDEEGACITGWIYDQGEGAADRYLPVDTDSPDTDKELCRSGPENLMFGSHEDGSLAVRQWVDQIPPWDNEGDDARSFYADSSGYMVTRGRGRGEGVSFSARRKATKMAETGTYRFEDWSTDANIVYIDGNYYCLEDSGTRMDGMIYLTGADGGSSFADGLYCFMDNAAMKTGTVMKENISDDDGSDGYVYYYSFAERDSSRYSKGQGISGVHGGRLYYHGMAVGAQYETFEVVYLPTLEEQDDTGQSTGLFLVDAGGRVKTGSRGGSHYTSSDGNVYRVTRVSDRNDDYGYVIEYYDGDKDDDNHKIWKSLTEKDYDYICWDAVEE